MVLANELVEFYALLVTIILLVWSFIDQRRRDRQSVLMRDMLIFNMILILSFEINSILEGHPEYSWIRMPVLAMSFSFGFPMAGCYNEFVIDMVQEKMPVNRYAAWSIRAICAFGFLLNVVSIFNGMYFSVDAAGIYHRGPLFWLNQAFSVYVLLPIILLVIYYRKELGRRNVLVLISYTLLPLIAAAAQFPLRELDTMCLATTLSLLIIYVTVYAERSQRMALQEKELTEARVDVMLSQIQPHFLYNTLAVIQDMCHGKAPEAETALIQFSEFLRGNMDSLNARRPIPFVQELKHTQNYLSLEQKRFGSRLNVVYDIETVDFSMPSLTLQPIVENAVRYGVTQREEGGTVRISSVRTGSGWQVTVEDNGVGMKVTEPKPDGRTHIGIMNVKARLAAMCGGTLDITSEAGKGTRAVIYLPERRASNEDTGSR